MKPLSYYSSLPSDSEIFSELMLRYGVTLEKISEASKFSLLFNLAHEFWFLTEEEAPDDIIEMYDRLSDDGKLALIEAIAIQLRESKRQQRVTRQVVGEVAITAKNEVL